MTITKFHPKGHRTSEGSGGHQKAYDSRNNPQEELTDVEKFPWMDQNTLWDKKWNQHMIYEHLKVWLIDRKLTVHLSVNYQYMD